MKMFDLKPAREFAIQYGFKSVIYGGPGSGKTPGLNLAPRPVLCCVEPGMLSMRNSSVPTFCAFTAEKIDEFFKWVFHSDEIKNFDTIGVDSSSQMCEVYLQSALKTNKHGLKAYGEMATKVMENLRGLYFLQQKHIYLIAKEETLINDDHGLRVKRPYFPGRQIPVEVPHMFDAVLRLGTYNIPSVGQQKAFRCIGSLEEMARDRTGSLSEFEPAHFGNLVMKAMSYTHTITKTEATLMTLKNI